MTRRTTTRSQLPTLLAAGAVLLSGLAGCPASHETDADQDAAPGAQAPEAPAIEVPQLVQVGMYSHAWSEDELDGATNEQMFDLIGARLERAFLNPEVADSSDDSRLWRLDVGKSFRDNPESTREMGIEFGADEDIFGWYRLTADGGGRFTARTLVEPGSRGETDPAITNMFTTLPLGVFWMTE